jgi:hypothetical protein
VAKSEGENHDADELPNLDEFPGFEELPDFGDLGAFGEEALPTEAAPLPEVAQTPVTPAEGVPPEPIETQPTPTDEKTKPSRQLPGFVPWAGAIGLPVVILVLAVVNLLSYATAVFLILAVAILGGLWIGRQTSGVYTILLACALLALLTAIYFLWMQLGRYDFEIKARPKVGVSGSISTGSLARTGDWGSRAKV